MSAHPALSVHLRVPADAKQCVISVPAMPGREGWVTLYPVEGAAILMSHEQARQLGERLLAEVGAAAVVGRAHTSDCTGYERCDGYVAEEPCPCGCHLREEVYASTAA